MFSLFLSHGAAGLCQSKLSQSHFLLHTTEPLDYETSYKSSVLLESTRPYLSFNAQEIHPLNRVEARESHDFAISQAKHSLDHEKTIFMPQSSTSGSSSPSSCFCSSTTTSYSSTPTSTHNIPIYVRPRRPVHEQALLAMLEKAAENDGPFQPAKFTWALGDCEQDNPLSNKMQYSFHDGKEISPGECESFSSEQNLHNIFSEKDYEKFQAAVVTGKKSNFSSQDHGEASLHLPCKYNALSSTQTPRPFEFTELENATNGFSRDNFLEDGNDGFFKGTLTNGQLVIVKEHKRANFQSEELFSSMVTLLGKAQHPNIVSLIGFSVERHMLIYEDVIANKSLEWCLSCKLNHHTVSFCLNERP